MYGVPDAIKAFFQYHLNQGLDERQIDQPGADSVICHDDYRYSCEDDDGSVIWEVQFTDDEGSAIVTLPQLDESGRVNINPDEDED